MRRIVVVIAGLTLFLGNDLIAQERGVWSLKPGQNIRISSRGGTTYEGPLLGLLGDTLVIGQPDEWYLVPVQNVNSLWVRGNAAKSGAIVGSVVVGFSSLGLWVAACNAMGPCEAYDVVFALGLAGAAGGALLGGLIGAMVPKWKQRFPPRGFRATIGPQRHGRFGFNASVLF